jgi:hypothetical protein
VSPGLGVVASAKTVAASGSPVSVVQVKTTVFAASGPQTVTFTEPVVAGDKVAVTYFCHRASSVRSIASIVGMGGTWAVAYNPGTGHTMWLGTGVTATGAITITQNAAAPMTSRCYLIRGLTSNTVAGTWNNLNAGNPVNTGLLAGRGQICIHWIGGFDSTLGTLTFPAPVSPASGWVDEGVTQDGINGFGSAYRLPPEFPAVTNSTVADGTLGDTIQAFAVTIGAAA